MGRLYCAILRMGSKVQNVNICHVFGAMIAAYLSVVSVYVNTDKEIRIQISTAGEKIHLYAISITNIICSSPVYCDNAWCKSFQTLRNRSLYGMRTFSVL